MTITKITARPGSKIMKNADRLFDNSPSTIADELTQNSRRAEATEITWTVDGPNLIVSDNGKGLPRDKAHVLLLLGDSANTIELDERENAAGIGFFCLAKNHVVVKSNNWKMTISPKAFRQIEDATLEDTNQHQSGLSIKIYDIITDEEVAKDWRKTLIAHSRFSGLVLHLKNFPGFEDETILPQNFLGAQTGLYSATAELPGLTIKLVRSRDHRNHYFGPPPSTSITFNFYGQLLTLDKQIPLDLVPAFPLLEAYEAAVDDSSYEIVVENTIFVDVRDTSLLQLKLPDRNSIIATDNLAIIRNAINHLYVNLLSDPSVPNGLDLNHPLRKSHPLPFPTKRLEQAMQGSRHYHNSSDLLVVRPRPDDPTKPMLVNRQGLEIDPASITLGDPEDAYWDYVEHFNIDALKTKNIYKNTDITKTFAKKASRLVGFTIIFAQKDDEYETDLIKPAEFNFSSLEGFIEEQSDIMDLEGTMVDGIFLRLHIARNGKTFTETFPIGCFAWASDNMDWTCPNIIITKGASLYTIVRLLIDVTDWLVEDSECDTYDTQERYAEESFQSLIAPIIGCSDEVRQTSIIEAVRDKLFQTPLDINSSQSFKLVITRDSTSSCHSVELVPLDTMQLAS